MLFMINEGASEGILFHSLRGTGFRNSFSEGYSLHFFLSLYLIVTDILHESPQDNHLINFCAVIY